MGHSVTPGKTVIVTLTFSIWHFKCQVSAMTKALYNLNAHCLTSFLFYGMKRIYNFGTMLSCLSVEGKLL
jgi:fumarate reductase subunit D